MRIFKAGRGSGKTALAAKRWEDGIDALKRKAGRQGLGVVIYEMTGAKAAFICHRTPPFTVRRVSL